MGKFFMDDNPFNRFMTKVFDLCLLNVLVFISCIPVVTAGAAFTAMYKVTLAMTEDKDGPIIKMYTKAFKENFKGSVKICLINLLLVALLLFDIFMWSKANAQYRSLFYAFTVTMLVAVCAWSDWYYAVRSKFDDSVRNAVKNAGMLAMIYLPISILMGASTIGLILLAFRNPMLLMLMPICGFVVLAYPKSHYIRRKFDAYLDDREMESGETE